jgi:hypothetical protein
LKSVWIKVNLPLFWYSSCTSCKSWLKASVKIVGSTVCLVSGSIYEIVIYSDVTLWGFGLYILPSYVFLTPLSIWSAISSLYYLRVIFVGVIEHLHLLGFSKTWWPKQLLILLLIVFFICHIIL